MMFRDQVGVLAGWFKGWNECEQTVALLSLLKRVSHSQARFLQLCLEHSLADCAELHILENEANNPGKSPFSSSFSSPPPSGSFCILHCLLIDGSKVTLGNAGGSAEICPPPPMRTQTHRLSFSKGM